MISLETLSKFTELQQTDVMENLIPIASKDNLLYGVFDMSFIPDYASGISIILALTETTYICPSDGVITIDTNGFYNNYAYLYINNIEIANRTTNHNDYLISLTGEFIVKKGDVIRVKAGYTVGFAGTNKLQFFPFKGAN